MAWLHFEFTFWKDFFELHPKLKGLGCSAIQNIFLNSKSYFCTYLIHSLPCKKKDSYNCSSLISHLSLHAAQLNVLRWVPCLTERKQRAGWEKALQRTFFTVRHRLSACVELQSLLQGRSPRPATSQTHCKPKLVILQLTGICLTASPNWVCLMVWWHKISCCRQVCLL